MKGVVDNFYVEIDQKPVDQKSKDAEHTYTQREVKYFDDKKAMILLIMMNQLPEVTALLERVKKCESLDKDKLFSIIRNQPDETVMNELNQKNEELYQQTVKAIQKLAES